nr:MAG TPA: hypothetical protein [Caudoviricetes sp.]
MIRSHNAGRACADLRQGDQPQQPGASCHRSQPTATAATLTAHRTHKKPHKPQTAAGRVTDHAGQLAPLVGLFTLSQREENSRTDSAGEGVKMGLAF